MELLASTLPLAKFMNLIKPLNFSDLNIDEQLIPTCLSQRLIVTTNRDILGIYTRMIPGYPLNKQVLGCSSPPRTFFLFNRFIY